MYIAVCSSGREKDKTIRGTLCTSGSLQEIEVSGDYTLYRSSGFAIDSSDTDIILDLTLKDSTNVISVGVSESSGDFFPLESNALPIIFSLN